MLTCAAGDFDQIVVNVRTDGGPHEIPNMGINLIIIVTECGRIKVGHFLKHYFSDLPLTQYVARIVIKSRNHIASPFRMIFSHMPM